MNHLTKGMFGSFYLTANLLELICVGKKNQYLIFQQKLWWSFDDLERQVGNTTGN